jgi:hypothetical protein
MPADDRKHLPEINIDVLVHGCEIPCVTAIGIAPVEKDKCCIGVRLDDRLHVGWRRQCKGDVRITETGVELNWTKVRSDACSRG